MYGHLPVTIAIAASGAAMVSWVEHATAWLISGSAATLLLALVLVVRTLVDFERLARVYQPASYAMLAGSAASLFVGWWRPAPWLLVLLLAAIQSSIWFFGIDRWLRYGGATAAPIEVAE
jgi:hypothetical protein